MRRRLARVRNGDGDADLADYGCFQKCYGTRPLSPECDAMFDYCNGNNVNDADYVLFRLSVTGPRWREQAGQQHGARMRRQMRPPASPMSRSALVLRCGRGAGTGADRAGP